MHVIVKIQGPALHGDPAAHLRFQGVRLLVAEKIKDGVQSIKWDKAFVEDPQWGLTEAKMRPLDITR